MTQDEYSIERRKAEEILGIDTRNAQYFDHDTAIRIATKMATNVLEAVVKNDILLPPSSFWVPEWVEVCENELFERVLLKSDKCL